MTENNENVWKEKQMLTKSGIPVACKECGKPLFKNEYLYEAGGYYCPECAKKIKKDN